MASRNRYELLVGVVFILAMLVLAYFTILKAKRIFQGDFTYTMTVIFPSVAGLELNSKTKINGVESGTVENIELYGHRVKVTLRLFNDFTLYENYSIIITTEAALGSKLININPGYPIDSKGRQFAVVETRQNLNGRLEDALSSITTLVEENRDEIRLAIVNLRQILQKINDGEGTLGKLVNEDTVHKETDKLVKELREAIEDTREQAPINSFLRAALTAF